MEVKIYVPQRELPQVSSCSLSVGVNFIDELCDRDDDNEQEGKTDWNGKYTGWGYMANKGLQNIYVLG